MPEAMNRPTVIVPVRDVRLFIHRPHLLEELAPHRVSILLAPHQLVALDETADWVVRLGRLRFSEFLSDGRELTRNVLQAGSCFMTRAEAPQSGGDECYTIDAVVLMALGEAELWRLEPGKLTPLFDHK